MYLEELCWVMATSDWDIIQLIDDIVNTFLQDLNAHQLLWNSIIMLAQ